MSISDNTASTLPFKNRIFLTFLIFLLLILHNYLDYSDYQSNKNINCSSDNLINLTHNMSKFVKSIPNLRRGLMIVSSFIIDVSVFTFTVCWILYSRTWRPFLNVGLFYALRGLCNVIFAMRKHEDFIWEFPGIYSATVSYHDTTDFFFSGHVGINLIAALELRRFKLPKLSYLSYFGIIVQVTTMMVTRGHYSIDLVAGLIAAHYLNILSYKLTYFPDSLMNVDYKVKDFFMAKSIISEDDLIHEFDKEKYD